MATVTPSRALPALALAVLLPAAATTSTCSGGERRPDAPDDAPAGADAGPGSGSPGDCGPLPGSLSRRLGAILSRTTVRIVVSAAKGADLANDAATLERRLRDAGVKVDGVRIEGRTIEVLARMSWPHPDALAPLLRPGRLTVHEVADAWLDDLLARESGRFEGEEGVTVVRMDDRSTNLMAQDEEALRRFLGTLDVGSRTWGLQKAGDWGAPTWHALLLERPALDGSGLLRCEARFDTRSWQPELALRLDERARQAFESLTTRVAGSRIAVVLDGDVLSAPVVMEPITGPALRISQEPSVRSLHDVLLVLRSGALSGPLSLVSIEEVAPASPPAGAP